MPADFLHREHPPTHPTAAERDAARAKLLPYLARERFNHQRVDDRRDPPPTFTFVRRPTYYAAFNTGNQKNEQRLGLGVRDLPDGDLVVAYDLGTAGTKQIRFLEDRIEVFVTHPGEFREQIPLLVLTDDEVTTKGTITLRRGAGSLSISPSDAVRVTTTRGRSQVGPYRTSSVHLHGREKLAYTMRIITD